MAKPSAILNARPRRLPGPQLLHDLVARVPFNNQSAIEFAALDGGIEYLDYGRLHARSDALAARLAALRNGRSHGRPERFIVPLYIPQCTELYVSQLAVLKGGGAFCPISTDVPEERLRFILKDIQADMILTTSATIEQLPPLDGIQVLRVDEQRLEDQLLPWAVKVQPSDAAYVMYTSGSTGTPKGVVVSHSAATQALLAHDRHIPSFKRFLQFANPTFDVSIFEIFFPLFRGATVAACDRRQLLDDLPGVIERLQVDAAELTPSVAASLLHDRSSVPGLGLLLTIGEMLNTAVIQEFGGGSNKSSILYGMYGPTEAAIHCTLQPSFLADMPVGNIGLPLETVSAFIVKPVEDGAMPNVPPQIVELGQEGELAVGGHQLADGYLNRPEQTAAAFVQHPEFGRLYRTGDRARLTGEGRLECLGRISSGQIKLRGQRIELGEIEHAAVQTPGCKTVVADVLSGALVAFCVVSNTSLRLEDVRQTCRNWLPAFMIPADVVLLERLPYLSSGKVDRKALSSIYAERQEAQESQEAVVSSEARRVAVLVGNVLNANVSASTDLQTVGLDSLSAIRVASELRRNGFAQLNANSILEARSAQALAGKAISLPDEPNRASTDHSELHDALLQHPHLADSRHGIDSIFPCTPIQAAMLARTAIDPQAYCNKVVLEVQSGVGSDGLLAALQKLSEMHPMLRAGFVAATQCAAGYAVVVWKTLLPAQVQTTATFSSEVTADSDNNLLRPCRFELRSDGTRLSILVQIHHALYDQWSIDVLKQDLSALLRSDALDQPVLFEEFSNLYNAMVASSGDADKPAFWQDHLRDMTVTPLPNLNPRIMPPKLQRTTFQYEGFDLGAARDITRKLGFGLPAVFQAALAYLMSCYCGSPDVVFGTVFSGRHLPIEGIERIFGPCLTTLPCRVDVASARTCLDLVRVVHDTNRAMLKHATTPLADIRAMSELAPETPLFDTLFVWQETSLQRTSSAAVIETYSEDHHEFNLVMEFDPAGDSLSVRVTYQQSLLPAAQVDLMFRQLQHLAQHLIRSSETDVGTLATDLTPNLLSISNPQPSSCLKSCSVVRDIERHALLTPTAPAIAFATHIKLGSIESVAVTYAELNERANRLAHHLRYIGVSPGSLVCIYMEKTPDLYVAIVAALKAGAGYLPVVPTSPQARVGSILRQAEVKICLCDPDVSAIVSANPGVRPLVLSEIKLEEHPAENLQLPYCGSDPAYTVFTSGSTGEPKGVSVSHDNLASNLTALFELYAVNPGDRMLQACSQAFDVSVFEIFFTLCSGMCLCSATTATLFHDLELGIRELHVTHLSLTPTVAALINPANVPKVKFLVTAGEGVTDVVRRQWAGNGLHQGYGPSETTNICSVNMNMSIDDVLGNVGPPLRNTSTFIVTPSNDEYTLLPAGAIGELAFGGEQVFRGYVGRADLNSTKIYNHPSYGRVYRSGDTGRVLHDGSLLVTGRLDQQVKIRGNRVELQEIDSVLLDNEDVSDCSTIQSVDQTLATFWVPKAQHGRASASETICDDHNGTISQLFRQLEDHLPSYMIPSVLVPVTKLPVTSQTKLDRKFLQKIVDEMDLPTKRRFGRPEMDRPDTGALSLAEEEIADILAETLRIPTSSVGRNTSFFALGMHSLGAIAFARALSVKLGSQIRIDTIMRNPSVAKLSVHIASGTIPEPSTCETDSSRVFDSDFLSSVVEQCASRGLTVETVLPCTPLQESMLSSNSSEGTPAYCNTSTFRLSCDVWRLKQCWGELVARHTILRTHFVNTDSVAHPYAQVVVKEAITPWHAKRSAASNRGEDGPHGFDAEEAEHISMGRPFSIQTHDDGCGKLLLLRMHHAVYDGVSMAILLDECEHIYHAKSLRPAMPFEPFLDMALAQDSAEAMSYWSDKLHDFEPQPFPVTRDVDGLDGAPNPLTDLQPPKHAIEAFCKRHSVTPLSVFQAAWAKTLSVCQSTRDTCFGNVVSGRMVPLAGVESLVAPCFNTIPLRSDLARYRSNLQLVHNLHTQNVASTGFQLTPLKRIQTLSRKPHKHLFDSLLLLQPPERELDSTVWSKIDESGAMDMPVVVEIMLQGNKYHLQLHALQSWIPSGLAYNLSRAFASALACILEYPNGEVCHLGHLDLSSVEGSLKHSAAVFEGGDTDFGRDDVADDEWDASESMVREVFASLSGAAVSRITRNTSMYRLGLDSINAAQVAARLRAKGITTDATDVVENLTPRQIACAASRKQAKVEASFQPDLEVFSENHRPKVQQQLALRDVELQRVLPCTAAQCGMIAQSLRTSGALYINHLTCDIPTSVGATQAADAWNDVQRKHQALRTGFCHSADPSTPFTAVVWKSSAVLVPMMKDRTDRDPIQAELEAARNIVDHLSRPSWRLRFTERQGGVQMTLSLHHALYDAEGLQHLFSDLKLALDGKLSVSEMRVDALLLPILSWTTQQSHMAERFWKAALEHASFVRFPDLCPSAVNGQVLSTTRRCRLQCAALEQYCSNHGVTIQAVGQAAWAFLLAAYIGEDNVTFGTVFSHRTGSTSQRTAFPAISTVPVTCSVNGELAELVQRMVTFNANAHRHRHMPLADIQRHAGDAQRSLFDTVFVYQKMLGAADRSIDWPIVRETSAVDYVASLELDAQHNADMSIRLTVDSSRIPIEQAELMIAQYEQILAKVAGQSLDNPPKATLSIQAAKEPRLLSDVQYLHEFVEAQAWRTPDKAALHFVHALSDNSERSEIWTYRQLDERANQVAHLLRGRGVSPGRVVAVRMDKSAEAHFAFVGILKAGCSFLALDPELPSARLSFILKDSQAAALLVLRAADLDELKAPNLPVVELAEPSLQKWSSKRIDSGLQDPTATCYCLYTSGTTGAPKGCEVSHENAVQAMLAFQRLFSGHWTSSSKWLQFASYWFDVSVLEMFWSWGVGITVVGAPRDIVLEDLPGFISTMRITHIDLTPSLARLVHPDDVPSLHGGVFITGGEALKQEIIDVWGPKLTVCNGYGPTEATIGVTMNTFIGENAKPSNIGKQFDNVGTFVLEPASDEVVLRGAVGELCVSGKLVGKGYLNRPDLTAKAFPTLAEFGERVYRTGDLVRLLHDGSFSFIGRKDTQTKLRGQRLEIDEINSVIRTASRTIQDVVTLVAKDENDGKQTLVSFCTSGLQASRELEVEEARQVTTEAATACQQRLPSYMVPTHIIPVTVIPLTVNNKVDAKKLVALFNSMSVSALQALTRRTEPSSPLSDAERRIRDTVCGMLGIEADNVVRDTNVFSLGLSSVSAISLASLLKRKGFRGASVASIMQNPSIGQLAQAISETSSSDNYERGLVEQSRLSVAAFAQQHRNASAKRLVVDIEDIEHIAPCTPLQAGLLLESTRQTQRPYFNQFRYQLGVADIQYLQHALRSILADIGILRTKFLQTDDGFIQVVLRSAGLTWHDLSNVDTDFDAALSREREVWLGINEKDVVQPIRFTILHTASSRVLVAHVHHALYDGISWELLMDKVAESYVHGGAVDCGPSLISVLPHGPLREHPQAKGFWQKRLAHSSGTLIAPYESMKTEDPPSTANLCMDDGRPLESLRMTLGVSHQAILQACFEVVMVHHFDGVSTYGHVVSGRSIAFEGVEKVIGPMFNTLPATMGADSADSWEARIKSVHNSNAVLIPFQHTALRDIRKWCGQGASFDVLFVFQHQPERSIAEEHDLWTFVEQPPQADFPLAFEIDLRTNNAIEVTAVSRSEVADAGKLQSLLSDFDKALTLACEDAGRRISESFRLPASVLGANDKVEQASQADVNGVHAFEWSDQARALQAAIAQVAGINVDAVDEHSAIFTLGLDSIDAVRLASRTKKAGIPLPVSQILRAQTIPRMLQAVQDAPALATDHKAASGLAEMKTELRKVASTELSDYGKIEDVLPATPGQEALVADMIRSDFRDYYNHDVLHVDPEVDIARLRAAWQAVVDKSPILRTGFWQITAADHDATFAQVIWPSSELSITEANITSQEDLDALLLRITDDARRAFSASPLLRLAFVTWDTERYLVLSLAHAQYDGHSLALLHEDVRRAYHDRLEPRPPYTSLLAEAIAATNDEARDFWSSSLSGSVAQPFSARVDTTAQRIHRAELTSTVTSETVRSFCKRHGISMQVLAQTSWALLLASRTRNLTVRFGSVLACRDSEDAERIMFPAMNTVPVRAALHGSRLEMLRYMQTTINDMRPYQRTPLRTIQAACTGDVRLGAGGSMFDTLFIYQHRADTADEQQDRLYESVGGSSSVEYPVAVEMEALGDEVHMRAACKDLTLDGQGTRELLRQLDKVMRAILDAADQPTVGFTETGVSICSLPEFVLEHQEADHAAETGTEEGSADEPAELTSTAVLIREVLAQVAKVPSDAVSPSAAIESIGIDSISAIKVAALLRKQDINIPVSEILRSKTVTRMAEAVALKSAASIGESLPAAEVVRDVLQDRGLLTLPSDMDIEPHSIEATLPATAGQLYMLSTWQASAGQLFYPTFSYKVKGALEAEQLRHAWTSLVARHAILRTVFCATSDSEIPALQVGTKHTSDSFHLNAPPEHVAPTQPMANLYAQKLAVGWQLDLSIHHALYDAVSLPRLIEDFQLLAAGSEPSAQTMKQEDLLTLSVTSEARSACKAFWTSYLANAKLSRLQQPIAKGQQRRVEVFKPGLFANASALEQLARKESLTVQALFFAAYAKIYAGLTHNLGESEEAAKGDDIVLGIYLSNRSHLPDLDKLTAPTLNLVPLLVRSPGQNSLLELAKQIQVDLREIGSATNWAVALWEIAEWTGVRVDTFVNFLKLPEQSEESCVASEGGVVIEEMNERRTREYSRVTEPEEREFEMPKELRDMKVKDAYQFSLDLEATVANGTLDVGLFCPQEMLGLKEAEGVLEEVSRSLEKLVGKAKQ